MFKVLTEGCEPIRATKHSAAIDLYASEDVTIPAGKTAMIGLGVCIDLDTPQLAEMKTLGTYNDFLQSHYLALEPRSSLRAKGLVAGTGIIDLDFKDELKLILINPITDVQGVREGTIDVTGSGENCFRYYIKKGDRIAQVMLLEHKSSLFNIGSDVERTGGFGSTNKESK